MKEENTYFRIEKEPVVYPFISIGVHGTTGKGIRGYSIGFLEVVQAEIGAGKIRFRCFKN